MTDKDIIKALEICSGAENICKNCYLLNYSMDYNACMAKLMTDAKDLITRQQAEIDSLRADLKRACAERDMRICKNNFTESAAIADFAEKLKRNAVGLKLVNRDYRFVSVKEIDSLVIKMAGETHEL